MGLSRIYTQKELKTGQKVVLETGPSRHIVNALRKKEGDRCVLFNGAGSEFEVTLVGIESRQAVMLIGDERKTATESSLWIHLVQGISRGDRMDFAIQSKQSMDQNQNDLSCALLTKIRQSTT